jgi:hypothetical protein
LGTWLRKLPEKLHRIFRCVSFEFPLRAISLVVHRAIHFI